MNKQIRGDPFSLIILIVLVLVAGVVAYIITGFTGHFAGELKDDLNATGGAQEAIDTAAAAETDAPVIGDNLVFWFFIAGVLGFWISAAYVGFSPVTIGIYILVIVLAIFLGAQAADIRDEFKTDFSEIGSANFALSNALFGRYWPVIIAAVGIIGLIIMYSKKGEGNLGPQ